MPTYKFTIGDYITQPKFVPIILTGQIFDRLTVIGYAGRIKQKPSWHCLCECGNGITTTANGLRTGHIRSCGCSRRKPERGTRINGKPSPEYRCFTQSRNRCNNPNFNQYSAYGGRGIEFRFNSFQDFLNEIGPRPTPQHSLDRIDNSGHYEKGNVRWATRYTQSRNRQNNIWITAFGKTQCATDWAVECGISSVVIRYRLAHNWCAVCTLTLTQGRCQHKSIPQ